MVSKSMSTEMQSLDVDLLLLLILFFLIAVPLTDLLRTRWNASSYLRFVAVVVVLGVILGTFHGQVVNTLMIPTLTLWDLPGDYSVVFAEGRPVRFVVLGALSLSAPYVINRKTRAAYSILLVQGCALLSGMLLGTFLYPGIVSLTLIPKAERRTTGHSILTGDDIFTSALVAGLISCAIVTEAYWGRSEARRFGYFAGGPKWVIGLMLATALLGAKVEPYGDWYSQVFLLSAVVVAAVAIYGMTALAGSLVTKNPRV